MQQKIHLILDLDGVLITTASWKADEIEADGYSKFSKPLVDNLNTLLNLFDIEIWLSSSRRITKTLEEFNILFRNRGIVQSIAGFLPYRPAMKNRKEEVVCFINENKLENYLILDDDKSLNDLPELMKERLVLTEYLIGFNKERLNKALIIIGK